MAKLNTLALVTLVISVDLDLNEKAYEKAVERKYDMTSTRGERLVAAFEVNALKVKYRELIELLQDTVEEYHDAESTLRAYDTLYNEYRGYGIDFGPYSGLPEIYLEHLRPIDPKDVV